MKNRLIFIISILLINFFCGCASLNSVSYFENKRDKPGWDKGPVYYNYSGMPFTLYWNNYTENDLSIYLTPTPHYGNSLALGFSYIPVMIPNIFSITYNLIVPENDSLTFEVVIISTQSDVQIDLSKASFEINEDEITPTKIYCSKVTSDTTVYKEYMRSPKYFGVQLQNIYKYTNGLIKLNNEILYVAFQLPIKKTEADNININFEQVICCNDIYKIKNLLLQKERQYIYDPSLFMRALNH